VNISFLQVQEGRKVLNHAMLHTVDCFSTLQNFTDATAHHRKSYQSRLGEVVTLTERSLCNVPTNSEPWSTSGSVVAMLQFEEPGHVSCDHKFSGKDKLSCIQCAAVAECDPWLGYNNTS
jgi:hypothetical protein